MYLNIFLIVIILTSIQIFKNMLIYNKHKLILKNKLKLVRTLVL